ncbi:HepT-like ribonuclease domain-containing protein [Coraliomargarita parva]|uniref:HepT-like ribonuclease domain-containing protein n=1 Tax=Coraliomargarita parva TaxID=3014050 RepID=UPI0022B3AC28|nr:DUF86 domain-containing protein [Coraliomargarita parva]
MSRDPILRLEDMLESIEWIESHIEGYDYERFAGDRKTIDAVTRCLEVVGEASKHLPSTWTAQHPEIPWRAISGFRDVLAHSYFRAEDSIIWDAATQGVQALKPAIQALLKQA